MRIIIQPSTIKAAVATDKEDHVLLKKLIQAHFDKTGSAVAKFILADFDQQLKHMVKVFPTDYKKALQKQKAKLTAAK